jgi:hypothetical protein
MKSWKTTTVAVLGGVLLMLLGCMNPDAPIGERVQEVEAQVQAMRELGLSGRVVLIWGTGHAGGVSYNLSGSNGFAEITVDPPASEGQ